VAIPLADSCAAASPKEAATTTDKIMHHRDWESSCGDLVKDREPEGGSENSRESGSACGTEEGGVDDGRFATHKEIGTMENLEYYIDGSCSSQDILPDESSRHGLDCKPEGGSVDYGNLRISRKPEGGSGRELCHKSRDGGVSSKEAGAWENPGSYDCDSSYPKWLSRPKCFGAYSYSQHIWLGESSRHCLFQVHFVTKVSSHF
jgi:hypothetical protein